MSGDEAVLTTWWREFVATGHLPACLEPVQERLIRSVRRGALPSGPVHVKAMTFPRAKDRLRYGVRALPARHEAAMLRAVRAAGIPCPEVVAVFTRRRWGVPSHSLLVLRTLPTVVDEAAPAARFHEQAALAMRLLQAGIVHPDLHGENFVRLQDGALAVLDLQSASEVGAAATAAKPRLGVAARLLRGASIEAAAALAELSVVGLVRDDEEARQVADAAARDTIRYLRSRILRCLQESSEFQRRVGLSGIECRRRGPLPAGHWHGGAKTLGEAWIGQHALQLRTGREPLFAAYFRKWWWLGGGAALYVPATCGDLVFEAEVRAASSGYALLPERRQTTGGRSP